MKPPTIPLDRDDFLAIAELALRGGHTGVGHEHAYQYEKGERFVVAPVNITSSISFTLRDVLGKPELNCADLKYVMRAAKRNGYKLYAQHEDGMKTDDDIEGDWYAQVKVEASSDYMDNSTFSLIKLLHALYMLNYNDEWVGNYLIYIAENLLDDGYGYDAEDGFIGEADIYTEDTGLDNVIGAMLCVGVRPPFDIDRQYGFAAPADIHEIEKELEELYDELYDAGIDEEILGETIGYVVPALLAVLVRTIETMYNSGTLVLPEFSLDDPSKRVATLALKNQQKPFDIDWDQYGEKEDK